MLTHLRETQTGCGYNPSDRRVLDLHLAPRTLIRQTKPAAVEGGWELLIPGPLCTCMYMFALPCGARALHHIYTHRHTQMSTHTNTQANVDRTNPISLCESDCAYQSLQVYTSIHATLLMYACMRIAGAHSFWNERSTRRKRPAGLRPTGKPLLAETFAARSPPPMSSQRHGTH